jgi:hypothetical protein
MQQICEDQSKEIRGFQWAENPRICDRSVSSQLQRGETEENPPIITTSFSNNTEELTKNV